MWLSLYNYSHVMSECIKSDPSELSWHDHFCDLVLIPKRLSWFISQGDLLLSYHEWWWDYLILLSVSTSDLIYLIEFWGLLLAGLQITFNLSPSFLIIIYMCLINCDNGREAWWKIFTSKYLNTFLSLFQNLTYVSNKSLIFNNNNISK